MSRPYGEGIVTKKQCSPTKSRTFHPAFFIFISNFLHINRNTLVRLTPGFLNHREIELPVFVPFMPVELPYLLHL